MSIIDDIRSGRNLEAYVIVLISLVITLLSVFDYEMDEWQSLQESPLWYCTQRLAAAGEYRTYANRSPNPYDGRMLDLSDKLTGTSLELHHILAEMQKTVQERQTRPSYPPRLSMKSFEQWMRSSCKETSNGREKTPVRVWRKMVLFSYSAFWQT